MLSFLYSPKYMYWAFKNEATNPSFLSWTVFGNLTQGISQNEAIVTYLWLLHPFPYDEPADQVWKPIPSSLKDVAQTSLRGTRKYKFLSETTLDAKQILI